MYSRYHYGLDDTYQRKLVNAITDQMMQEDRRRRQPLLLHRYHWFCVIQMTLEANRGAIYLTRVQKKIAADATRWTRRHEEAHQKVRELLDNWDYELRSELGASNREQVTDRYV